MVLKAPKTNRIRTLRLTEGARNALKAQRTLQARWRLAAGASYSNMDDAIFTDALGRRVTPMAASYAFARFARKAGISTTRLHDVRHTTGTWLLAEGVDYATVARIFGHATPAVTLSV